MDNHLPNHKHHISKSRTTQKSDATAGGCSRELSRVQTLQSAAAHGARLDTVMEFLEALIWANILLEKVDSKKFRCLLHTEATNRGWVPSAGALRRRVPELQWSLLSGLECKWRCSVYALDYSHSSCTEFCLFKNYFYLQFRYLHTTGYDLMFEYYVFARVLHVCSLCSLLICVFLFPAMAFLADSMNKERNGQFTDISNLCISKSSQLAAYSP